MSDHETRPQETESTDRSRRGFLGKIWLVLGAVVTLQFLWIGFDLLKPRNRRGSRIER